MTTHFSKHITQKQLTLFTRQWATLLVAGIPLVQTLAIIARNQTNPALENLIIQLKKEIEAGSTLTQALQRYPNYFSALYCNLVAAGEQAGLLDTILMQIANYQERIEAIRSKIRKAMFYPIMVLIVACAVTVGLLFFVVPQFEMLFHSFNAQLPWMTQWVIDLSQWLQHYGGVLLLFLGMILGVIFYSAKKSWQGMQQIDQLKLHIPLLSNIVKKAAIFRFARTLSMTFAAGLPLVEALKIVAGTTGNNVFATAVLAIQQEVITGQSLYNAIKKTQLFPDMVLQMVHVGEESGSLELMLSKIADFYEQEVNQIIDSLSTLLEPIIMVVLGILVGGLVISMYLPIFKFGTVT